jgi:hypothetical protein
MMEVMKLTRDEFWQDNKKAEFTPLLMDFVDLVKSKGA